LFDAHEAVGRILIAGAEPAFNLLVRLVLAWDFFKSGLTRVDGWKFFTTLGVPADHWQKQIELFTTIHPLPFVPGAAAALLATAAEIVLPILLVIGLFTRMPALGLLAMTAVIEFVAAQTPQGIENGIANHQHILWMLLFGYLLIRGGGPLSIDGFVKSQRE
jgi:putative oxidoreductase